MLSALKTVFRIAENDNVMNVIPDENANFVFEFSEFVVRMFWFDFKFMDYNIACMRTFASTYRSSTRKNEMLLNLTNCA